MGNETGGRLGMIYRNCIRPPQSQFRTHLLPALESKAKIILGPGDLCAMKTCVHASAYPAFIVLSFGALVTYLTINLWLRGYGYQSKDTL